MLLRSSSAQSGTVRPPRAEAELAKATKVIEIQGKLSALLEEMLGTESALRSTER